MTRHWKLAQVILCSSFFAFLGQTSSAHADTTLMGGTIATQVWTPQGSPYYILGDVILPKGATLTILPGTEVIFANADLGAQPGFDSSKVELVIQGKLNAQGSPDKPIQFHCSVSNPGGWYGIVLQGLNDPLLAPTLSNVVVRDARFGFRVLELLGGLRNFSAVGNEVGVYTESEQIIDHAVIRQNSLYGVHVHAPANALVAVNIQHSTLHKNAYDAVFVDAEAGGTGDVYVVNSIVTGHTQAFTTQSSSGTAKIRAQKSNIWGNASDGDGLLLDTISENPLYVSDTNVRITSNSPCRGGPNLGDPYMGALPYTGDKTNGLLGYLWEDLRLTIQGSPHIATGDLTIPTDRHLTLAPGAQLLFASTDTMKGGADKDKSELRVLSGALVSEGTPAQPVLVGGVSKSPGSWHGITFQDWSSDNQLARLVVSDAVAGIRMSTGSSTTISRFTAVGNQMGVFLEEGSATITDAIIRNNTNAGVYFSSTSGSNSSLTVWQSTIHQNGTYGVAAENVTSSSSVYVESSIVTQHDYGIYIDSPQVSPAVSYSDVWGNMTNDYFGVTPDADCISANPAYVSAPANLKLQAGSAAIDKLVANNVSGEDYWSNKRPIDGDGMNGAAGDMGAIEYVPSTVCGDEIVGPGEVCDDGTRNGMYSFCNATCSGVAGYCGDGQVDSSEDCDDANGSNSDDCPDNCKSAMCGDGFLQAGVEECDDGNTSASDFCTQDCKIARCGDGIMQNGVPEECDDGNADDTDFCTTACRHAKCGDGIVMATIELCDDGNNISDDGCSAVCTLDIVNTGGGAGAGGMGNGGTGGTSNGNGGSGDAGGNAPGTPSGGDDGCSCRTGAGIFEDRGVFQAGVLLTLAFLFSKRRRQVHKSLTSQIRSR